MPVSLTNSLVNPLSSCSGLTLMVWDNCCKFSRQLSCLVASLEKCTEEQKVASRAGCEAGKMKQARVS